MLYKTTLLICLFCLTSASAHESAIKEINLDFCREEQLSPLFSSTLEARKKFHRNRQRLHNQLVRENLLYLQELNQWGGLYRMRLEQFHLRLTENKDTAITGAELKNFGERIHDFAFVSRELLDIISRYKQALYDFEEEKKITPKRLKALNLCLAAMMQLYNNSQVSVDLLDEHKQLRLSLRRGLKDQNIPEDFYEQALAVFYSTRMRSLTRKILKELEANSENLKGLRKRDRDLDALMFMVENSPYRNVIREKNRVLDFGGKIWAKSKKVKDSLSIFGNESMHYTSMAFGNASGIFQSRNGKLHKNKTVEKAIAKELKPLDILLEKTPFRLTDKFIPGHFGHVAIYTGTENQLKELGLWQHALIKPHHHKIRNGACIIEALRPGVVINSLEHFLNIDDFMAVRREIPNREDQCTYTLNCFRQIGKEYDFNFNVEESERIVCSELAYQVFTDDHWQTEKTLGRFTISPDHIIKKVFEENSPFKPTIFYHDGKKVKSENMQPLLTKLVLSDNS